MTSLVYFCVSLNVGHFGLDIYLTQFIFGLAEILSRLGCYTLLERLGRRPCQAGTLFFGGAACLLILAIPEGDYRRLFPVMQMLNHLPYLGL